MTSPPKNTFLGLPTEIRCKIYHEAGLIRGRCIPIVPRNSKKYQPVYWRALTDIVYGITHNLLQVSKQVNREVGILICAENTLAIVHEEIDYGLAFLRRLSPHQCAALKNLFIQLYHIDRARWYGKPDLPCDPDWKPIPDARLNSWLSTARHVLSNTYQALTIELFCHTGANSTTIDVLQPFWEYPGHLKDLELELDGTRGASHFELRTLAWETACRAKGASTNQSFPFFALPVEIQHQILTYTDLVTPYREIYWNAKHGFRVLRFATSDPSGPEHYYSGALEASNFFSCVQKEVPPNRLRCCDFRNKGRSACSVIPVIDVVCCYFRTAYSSRCRCWSNPKSLLVANRQLYREAIRVLYSCNRVIVVPSGDFRTAIGPISTRLDVAAFITRHMWPEVLRYLRDLECVFPCIGPSSNNLAHDPYTLDLCFAIDHLASNACMSRLHVSVLLTTAGSVHQDDTGWFHWQLKKLDPSAAVRSHSQLLSAFRSMKGIKDFFVKLEWAWHCYDKGPVCSRKCSRVPIAYFDEIDILELSLERMIMGDEYTPGLVKKMGRKPSVWPWNIMTNLEYFDFKHYK
ncbi:hypothetical protein F5Y19DRAFT_483874 [Xylariaceae sp. FL1651]|nr:hypothetical protein F5Y19DRAFT_483874 [Xylariaceae sp. FL1651]